MIRTASANSSLVLCLTRGLSSNSLRNVMGGLAGSNVRNCSLLSGTAILSVLAWREKGALHCGFPRAKGIVSTIGTAKLSKNQCLSLDDILLQLVAPLKWVANQVCAVGSTLGPYRIHQVSSLSNRSGRVASRRGSVCVLRLSTLANVSK